MYTVHVCIMENIVQLSILKLNVLYNKYLDNTTHNLNIQMV